jgi:hypothetical protein
MVYWQKFNPEMVYWQKFNPEEFDFEFDEAELAGGYQIIGYTDGGCKLKLIVYAKQKGLIRVITGWDYDH